MDTHSASENWHEFCFHLSDKIGPTSTEKDLENQVVRAIEVLGWREFKGEIGRQPTVKIGRQGSIRPDLIIYNPEGKALIVIEVKRPAQNIPGDDSIGQLMSYMRQMKSDFGLLIGTDLRIYYDGSLNPKSDPLRLETIPFDRSSPAGKLFVEIFNRDSFLKNEYKEYLEGKIKKFNQKQEIDKLIGILLSEETKEKIRQFLEATYADFGSEIYSTAMNEVSIELKRIQNAPDQFLKKGKPSKSMYTAKEMRKPRRLHGISILTLISSALLRPEETLTMTYGPRGSTKKTFNATVNSDGSLTVQGKNFSSPSPAAEYCMELAGNEKRSADGWIHWKNKDGVSLANLRKKI